MSEIAKALTRLFDHDQARIIFWYDEAEEMTAEFDALDLADVIKVTLDNNQFAVKHRILRAEPAQKFLLYHKGARPANEENWLLDIELAHPRPFTADQAALWLTAVGLPSHYGDLARAHAPFFKNDKFVAALRALDVGDDSRPQVLRKMVAVCVKTAPNLTEIMSSLLVELAGARDEKQRLLARCSLDAFLWEELERTWGYKSETPSVKDLALTLLRTGYAAGVGDVETVHLSGLNGEALIFLRHWQNNRHSSAAFAALSAQAATDLDIEDDLQKRPLDDLIDLDLFELIDRRILHELVRRVADRTLDAATCEAIVHSRSQSFWFEQYVHPYRAIECAAHFLQMLDTTDLTVRSLRQGVDQYAAHWYLLDQRYRQLIYHSRQSGLPTLLAPLLEQVENLYSNHFLLTLNDRWQTLLDGVDQWPPAGIPAQRDFWEDQVRKPFLTRGLKLFVIISDALRYEVGEELLHRVRALDRYDAELSPALTLLPSYTQLGMAALLPHSTLAIDENNHNVLLVDGQSAQGTENRRKILKRALPERATALQAEDLLNLNRDESRALFRDHEVVYIYQNRIDAIGDKRESEERVFDGVEEALAELIQIIKKLTNANVTNMIVTADHGFLYQHRPLVESDFIGENSVGSSAENVLHYDRRFVLGKGLQPGVGFKKFTAAQVGLTGDLELLLPKSINRLRQRGTGSRYVHGGAALQEVVIPILQINKKRRSDVSQVEVEIIRSGGNTITTSQLTITFYQPEPVTAKLKPRTLRAAFYSEDNQRISDEHTLIFDLTAEHQRQREIRQQFTLTRVAEQYNNQEVTLRLEEQIEGTTQYRTYRTANYVLRRSFTNDFDM